MAISVIWIDRDNAKLFHLHDHKMERVELHARQQGYAFFSELVPHLEAAARILILGPDMAKFHFQAFLAEQQPALDRKVVGCESVDYPSDGQITAYARKFLHLGAVKNPA